jgi:hypothetical protein
MKPNTTSDITNPEIFVTFKKTKGYISFKYDKEEYIVYLDGNKLDIIKVDEIITKILGLEMKKIKLRQSLMGDSDIMSA